MEDFVTSGRIASVALAVLGVEAAVLGLWLHRRQRLRDMLGVMATILAGGSLVLALRSAITGAGWLFVAIYLVGALLAHAADLALRLLATGHAQGVPPGDETRRS